MAAGYPVALPECGVPKFSWSMCRNPMCENFGVHFDPDEHRVINDRFGDANYIVSGHLLICRYCGQNIAPHSNEAVRPIARYFLGLSLPFATCPNSHCTNYGINVFEHYRPTGTGHTRHYRKRNSPHSVTCSRCGSHVTLGEALDLGENREVRRTVEAILLNVLKNVRKRRTIFYDEMWTSAYYSRLRKAGAILNGYHTWRNAALLDRRTTLNINGRLRIYTDVGDFTLRRCGDAHGGWRHLKVIVSALALAGTEYVLAMHPYFLPANARLGPPLDESFIDPESGAPNAAFAEKWACLEHPVHNRFAGQPKTVYRNQADVSRWGEGLYINNAYAEVAHFLVVRKMLSGLGPMCFYMDPGTSLSRCALVGLADGIRSREVDIVLFERRYRLKKGQQRDPTFPGDRGSDKTRAVLDERWNSTEKEVQRVFREGGIRSTRKPRKDRKTTGPNVRSRRRLKPAPSGSPEQLAAMAFSPVAIGAFGATSGFAWLRFPSPRLKEKQCRSLWLTRMPGKTYDDVGADCLLYSTVRPADGEIKYARDRTRAAARPRHRADKGRTFVLQYVDPSVVLAEMSIYLFCRNYQLMSTEQKIIPGRVLGLLAPREKLPPLADIVWDFRLNRFDAQKLTKWRRR